jgi:site-specific recombinase XerD
MAGDLSGLTIEDFSFLRGVISGMTPQAAYKQFYANTNYDAKGVAVVPHGNTINARLEELKRLILKDAGASADPKVKAAADLLQRGAESEPSVHTPETTAAAAIAFQDWYGLQPEDQYSEAEAIEAYELFVAESHQGIDNLPAVKSVVARSIGIAEQLNAINYLQGQLARLPIDSDKVSGHFAPSLAKSFKDKGVLDLRQMAGYISSQGRFWHRTIKGLGPGRARRIVGWLEDHSQSLTTPITRVQKNWFPSPALERDIQPLQEVDTVLTLVYQSGDGVATPDSSGLVLRPGFAPFELLAVPRQLDGRPGLFRCSAPNVWGAKHDLDAVRIWLTSYLVAGRVRTFEAYRREAERFLGWLYYVKECALSSVSLSCAMEYQSFLGFIEAQYISTARVTRGDPRWRPFRGQLSKGSQNYALGVITQMFTALHKAGYLTANAFLEVKPHLDAKAAIVLDTSHSLGEAELLLVKNALENLPALAPTVPGKTPPTSEEKALARRTRLILHLLLTTGMRREELATTRLSHVDRAVMTGPEESVLQIIGKGTKPRRIPISKRLLDMVQEHHHDWRELHLENQKRLDAFNIDPPLVAALEAPIRSARRNITDETILKNDNAGLSAGGIYRTLKSFFRSLAKSQTDAATRARILRVSTHWMRHTFALEVVEKADPRIALVLAQELLGHSSVSTTAIYLKQSEKAKVETMRLVNPLQLD